MNTESCPGNESTDSGNDADQICLDKENKTYSSGVISTPVSSTFTEDFDIEIDNSSPPTQQQIDMFVHRGVQGIPKIRQIDLFQFHSYL